jgi:hypothetical protein
MKRYKGIFVEEEKIDSTDDNIGAFVFGFAFGVSALTFFILWIEGII